MTSTLPQRVGLFIATAALAYIPTNPLVRLEALLGLSPGPLERCLGIKNLFSGMTEGMHQLVNGELVRALEANILTPLVACAFVVWVITGARVRTRHHEYAAAILIIGLSAVVNIVHPLS